MGTSLRDRLIALTEPLLASLGYELVDIEYVAGRSQATVRVYIDWPQGVAPMHIAVAQGPQDGSGLDGSQQEDDTRAFDGIGVDDCERVSRELSALLDVEDPIPGAYMLEVSSPGADRILRTPAHYQRFVGERVHVELQLPRDGRRRFTGQMTRADEQNIELNVDGDPVTIAIADIGKARLAPDWSRSPARR